MNCCCYFTVSWHYNVGNFELKLYKIDFNSRLSIFYNFDGFQIELKQN